MDSHPPKGSSIRGYAMPVDGDYAVPVKGEARAQDQPFDNHVAFTQPPPWASEIERAFALTKDFPYDSSPFTFDDRFNALRGPVVAGNSINRDHEAQLKSTTHFDISPNDGLQAWSDSFSGSNVNSSSWVSEDVFGTPTSEATAGLPLLNSPPSSNFGGGYITHPANDLYTTGFGTPVNWGYGHQMPQQSGPYDSLSMEYQQATIHPSVLSSNSTPSQILQPGYDEEKKLQKAAAKQAKVQGVRKRGRKRVEHNDEHLDVKHQKQRVKWREAQRRCRAKKREARVEEAQRIEQEEIQDYLSTTGVLESYE